MSSQSVFPYFFSCLTVYVLVASHIVMPTPGGTGLYLVVNIIGWLFISCLTTIGFWQALKNKKFIFNKLHGSILLAISLLIIPVFYSQPFTHFAIPRLLALFAGFTLLLSLSQLKFNTKDKELLLLLLLAGVLVESVIGIIQLYILLPLDIQIIGYTPLKGRPYGSFIQPNVMASFLATGIALAIFLLIPENINNTDKRLHFLKFICLFTFSVLITVLQSKTGYVATVLVLLCFFSPLIKNKVLGGKIFKSLMLGIIVGLLTLHFGSVTDRSNEVYQDKHRSDMYQVTGKMFINKPIYGYGYGNFERSYRELHLEEMKQDSSLMPPFDQLRHPHNEVLFWAAEGGIVALVGLIIFCYVYFRLFKGMAIHKALPLLALILPILLHSQTEFPLYSSVVHWFYFIVFIWLTMENTKINSKFIQISPSACIAIKVFVLSFLIAISFFMVTTIHTSIKIEQYKADGSKDISFINAIINKFAWQEQIDVALYNYHLKNGYAHKNTSALIDYINWGSNFVKHTPSKTLYQNMIISIQTLDKNRTPIDKQLKSTIYNDAVRLYPNLIKQGIAKAEKNTNIKDN